MLIQKAGIRVKEIREKQDGMKEQVKGETKEGAKEMLTEGDLQSHRTMVYGFAKAFPNLKVRMIISAFLWTEKSYHFVMVRTREGGPLASEHVQETHLING